MFILGQFMGLVIDCFTKKYADFSGRSRRKEYWCFFLFFSVLYFFLEIIKIYLVSSNNYNNSTIVTIHLILLFLIAGLTCVPSFALAVRRLHDLDRSGWWVLVVIIPIIGQIPFAIYTCFRGTYGENQFGPDPLARGMIQEQERDVSRVSPPGIPHSANSNKYWPHQRSLPGSLQSNPQSNQIEAPSSELGGGSKLITDSLEMTREQESEFFAKALKEIENNQKDPADWARAFAEAEGEEEKAKALYIKERVASLTDKFVAEEEQMRLDLAAKKHREDLKFKSKKERMRLLGEEQIRTQERANQILFNLGYTCDARRDGTFVLNNKVVLENQVELFYHLVELKTNLSDEFLMTRFQACIGTIIREGNDWVVKENPFPAQKFAIMAQLRPLLLERLFLEDD